MTEIEERLARDIAAVTRGVVVTDSDLQEARHELEDRIESRRRRDRSRFAVVAAAAAVAAVVGAAVAFQTLGGDDGKARPVAPPPSLGQDDLEYLTGRAPTAQLLQGVWRVDNGVTLMQFSPDGVARFTSEGSLFGAPAATSTFAVHGRAITFTSAPGTASECLGNKFVVQASSPKPGILRYVYRASAAQTGTECSALPLGRGRLEQLLPTSELYLKMDNSGLGGWHPLTKRGFLRGDWLAEGGGHILELGHDGSYYVADNSAAIVDRGRWALRGSELTLTSSAQSESCSQGDDLVFADIESTDELGTTVIRSTVAKNTCGGTWTPVRWVLLPHQPI